ncbi:MAG: GTP-binding protein, partial [Promethearchaeota archaeon]
MELSYKVIIVGPGAVGKTSLLNRFVHNEFTLKYKLTIG